MKLRPHQQKVVNYMKAKDPKGILLYHGLGSGKTITSIGIAELYKTQNKEGSCNCTSIYENTMGQRTKENEGQYEKVFCDVI